MSIPRILGTALGGGLAWIVVAAVTGYSSEIPTVDIDTPSVPVTTTSGPVAGGTGGHPKALAALNRLDVRVEDTGHAYDRDDYPHWRVVEGRCDAAELAYKAYGEDVRTDDQCEILSGRWVSIYDGETFRSTEGMHIDHIVPLKEIHRSHTRGWTRDQRAAIANDGLNLRPVSARSNTQKGDSDPADWMPQASARCGYAIAYIGVKEKYDLSIDQDEKSAIRAGLRHCQLKGQQ